jgi:putative SOS response-associated peptidase YedK
VCNLYSVKTSRDELKALARAMGEWLDETGNLQPLPAIFPNWVAPVVRPVPGGGRQATYMKWGFPPPTIPGFKSRNPYLTNVRKTESKFWLPYLKNPEHRCLVPVTSFAEPDNTQGPRSSGLGSPATKLGHWCSSPASGESGRETGAR